MPFDNTPPLPPTTEAVVKKLHVMPDAVRRLFFSLPPMKEARDVLRRMFSRDVELLVKIREHIAQPDAWGQGHYGYDSDRKCLVGWVHTTMAEYRRSLLSFNRLGMVEGTLISFNDHPLTERDDVLAILDLAIADIRCGRC